MNFDYMDLCLGIIVGVGPRNITSRLTLWGRPINIKIGIKTSFDPFMTGLTRGILTSFRFGGSPRGGGGDFDPLPIFYLWTDFDDFFSEYSSSRLLSKTYRIFFL